jgi:DNA-binding XRE family transcriptional regulator
MAGEKLKRTTRRESSRGDVDDVSLNARRSARELLLRLREARLAAGLTQEEVGRRCGIAHNFISLLETGGVGNPALLTLYRFAAAVGLDLELWLSRPKK